MLRSPILTAGNLPLPIKSYILDLGIRKYAAASGTRIHGFSVSTRRSFVSTFVSSGTLLINCDVDLITEGGGVQSSNTRGFGDVVSDFSKVVSEGWRLRSLRRVYAGSNGSISLTRQLPSCR
jgi:hypothetical protein